MKRVLHISDLHFGRIHPPAIESLEQFLLRQDKKVDLIIMTGDWTQRARPSQFKQAADFIRRLNAPVLSIPGNHDVPLYNFLKRFLLPFHHYNLFIKPLTMDLYEDPELVVVGLRTATIRRTVEGRIMSRDIARVEENFKKADSKALRVIACHHPLYEKGLPGKIGPRSRIDKIMNHHPHLVLSGHLHLSGVEMLERQDGHKTLHLSAGSALSNRLRGQGNNFNILEIDNLKVTIETYFLKDNGFVLPEDVKTQSFNF